MSRALISAGLLFATLLSRNQTEHGMSRVQRAFGPATSSRKTQPNEIGDSGRRVIASRRGEA